MFALNVFSICALAVLVWTAHELCLLPAARRERALRRLSALLLGVNILKYALPPLLGGKLVLPVEFSAAAYFTTPGIILMTRGKLRCWAAYAGLLAGGVYYGAMCLAGGYIYGRIRPRRCCFRYFATARCSYSASPSRGRSAFGLGMRRCCRWALLEWLRVRRCSGHGPGAAPCSSTGCWTRALYARPGLQRRCPSTTPPWPPLC